MVDQEIARAELEKYQRYWTIPGERNVSPAMRGIEAFAAEARRRGIKRVLDLGCGMGKSLEWLIDEGFDAVGCDIAENCLNDDLRHLPFVCAPAWDLPFGVDEFDCVHCVDVLEHVPPELVEPALVEIFRAAPVAYLEIATFARSVYVRGDARPLEVHLSVHPDLWWVGAVAAHAEVAAWRRREPPKTQGVEVWACRHP